MISLSIATTIAFSVYFYFFTVKVNFRNQTGYKLEKLKIGNRNIGTVEKDSETGFIHFSSFKFDGDLPNEKIYGLCDNKLVEKNMCDFYECGTFKSEEYFGKYQMSIKIIKEDNEIKMFSLETIK